ncbi:MAG: T9SS type A sorting domain-containing protein [Bacteroidales bacterium]|nr:T9SS type A sorting domain-containing protein [Bacteroidales bacterium]
MNLRKFIVLVLLSAWITALYPQTVPDTHIKAVAESFLRDYLGEYRHTVIGINTIDIGESSTICHVDLAPEGWLLMSRDWSARPVLAFSLTGKFTMPPADHNDNRFVFLASYANQLEEKPPEQSRAIDPGWDKGYYLLKSSSASTAETTVAPLIKVKWNQGSTWNRFCPEDAAGPGGHVYVGCVAVSMAQAMSVFKTPVSGTGVSQYYHSVYGTIYQDFSQATYNWDEMSEVIADDSNALLLYHCAVAVNMDFSPDGSGTRTSAAAATALKQYFLYSQRLEFFFREQFTTSSWKGMLDSSLASGCPIIYSGYPEVGATGHAFNIDGVHKSNYYHLNWGWSGSNDGYYTIDNLKPGGSDFTKGHTAIVGIRPYYYPTDIALSDTLVLLDRPAGEGVAHFSVVDEAMDNTYEITLECDSSVVGTELIPDYYLDGDSLRTSRPFERADGPVDVVTFIIKDAHGNEIRADQELLLTASLSAGDGELPDSFNIYPVPLKDQFIITFPPGETTIRITNLRGTEVASVIDDSGRITVPSSGMTPGIYIVTVTDSRGRQYSKTVVKN